MDKNRKQLEERAAWALCIIVTVIVFGATNIAYLGWRYENFGVRPCGSRWLA